MNENSPNLQLPYILPDQAQKHVTHNEALQRLDSVSQMILLNTLAAPPASPVDGGCYAVAANATGLWLGRDGYIAAFQDGDWVFIKPKRGWLAWSEAAQLTYCFDGTSWVELPLPPIFRTGYLGVNATPDASNRVAVSSAGSLFNHAGAGHQVKVNKANDTSTASMLFQNNFVGRAELGLTGDNDLTVKVSPDGATWNPAISIDSAGVPRMPNRPACRASLNSAALTPAANSYYGFQMFSINQGKFTLGAAVSPGVGQRLVIPATGFYYITLNVMAMTSSGHSALLIKNGTTTILTVKGSATNTFVIQAESTLASLSVNDTLMVQHVGTAQLDVGPTKTEMMLFMV